MELSKLQRFYMIADWRLFCSFAPLLRPVKALTDNGAKSSVATAFNRTLWNWNLQKNLPKQTIMQLLIEPYGIEI